MLTSPIQKSTDSYTDNLALSYITLIGSLCFRIDQVGAESCVVKNWDVDIHARIYVTTHHTTHVNRDVLKSVREAINVKVGPLTDHELTPRLRHITVVLA